MRAFVVGTAADISPISEAGCQLITQALGNGSLSNFTLQEVSDVTGSVGLIALTQNLGNAITVDQGVALVKSAVGSNSSVMSFLAAAAQGGQTTQGTSDIGNFFPFEQGSIWRYGGTISPGVTHYDTTVLVSGQGPAPISGVTSTIFSETNPRGENRVEKDYDVKGPTGIVSHGNDDPSDDLTRQLLPFQLVRFPLTPGTSTLLAERTGLDWGDDEDGDGRNETFSINLFQTVLPTESVTVPAGTFSNSVHIEFSAVFVVSSSGGLGQVTLTQTTAEWYASGVGKVKDGISIQINNEAPETVLAEELEGYVVNGQGSGARIELGDGNLGPGSPLNLRLENTRQLFGALYDQSNTLLPGVPFLYSSTNPQVVSINAEGVATALSPGTAIITARFGSLVSNEVPITVNDVRVRSLPTKDMVYDPVSRKLYASVPNNSGGLSNTITMIDPESGTIGQSLNVGLDPGKLAVSDNGQYLYVGLDGENAIRRVSLSAFTAGPKFFLSTLPDPNCPVWTAGEIRVQSGNPLVVAVLKRRCGNPEGVEIYDNGIKRPDVVSVRLSGIAFSQSPETLFGIEAGTFGHIYRLTVSSTGVAVSAVSPDFQEPFGIHLEFDSGRLFSTSTQVFDATTLNELGRFQDPDLVHGGIIAPDIGRNRVIIIPNAGSPKILGFDATTLQLVGTIPILHNLDSTFGLFEGSFTKWGTNGLAFRAGNDPGVDWLGVGDKIVLVRTTAIP